ncbi:hypothetical protein P7C70_g4498, partial [Phenoliferia sp. Uapishka_3]
MSTPNRSLSKGTLGLKFMNRVQPKPLISVDETPTPAAAPVASTSGTSIRASAKVTNGKASVKAEKVANKMEGVEQKPAIAAPAKVAPSSSTRQIIREGSLLSFPLLSASTSTSSSSSYSYSSMPMTSSVISGRRSFGGANADIERLNNPTLPPPVPTAPESEKTDKKKRKKVERDELPLNVRQNSTSNKGSFQDNSDKISLGGGGGGSSFKREEESEGSASKKQRIGLPQGQFAKPKGFEGAKRGGGARGGGITGKGRGREPEPVWGKQGTERAWDAGKEESEDEFEEEDSDSDSDEDDSDDEDVAELLVAKSDKSRGEKAKFNKSVGNLFKQAKEPSAKDRAIADAEMAWDDEETSRKGPVAKAADGKKKKNGKKQQNPSTCKNVCCPFLASGHKEREHSETLNDMSYFASSQSQSSFATQDPVVVVSPSAAQSVHASSSRKSNLPLTLEHLNNLTAKARKSHASSRAWADTFGRPIVAATSSLVKHRLLTIQQAEVTLFGAMPWSSQQLVVRFLEENGHPGAKDNRRLGWRPAKWMLHCLLDVNIRVRKADLELPKSIAMVGIESTPSPVVSTLAADELVRKRAEAAVRRVNEARWARQRLHFLAPIQYSKVNSFDHSKAILLDALATPSRHQFHQIVALTAIVRNAAGAQRKSTHPYGTRFIEELGRSEVDEPRRSWRELPFPVPFTGSNGTPLASEVIARRRAEEMPGNVYKDLVSLANALLSSAANRSNSRPLSPSTSSSIPPAVCSSCPREKSLHTLNRNSHSPSFSLLAPACQKSIQSQLQTGLPTSDDSLDSLTPTQELLAIAPKALEAERASGCPSFVPTLEVEPASTCIS